MPQFVDKYLDEILLTQEEIQARIAELGAQISADYEGGELLLICVLKGGVPFLTDLMRHITIPHEIDFMAVSSYGRGVRETTGVVRLVKDLDEPVQDKHVLIVEDIIDSGVTLGYLVQLLSPRNPASLKICTLLNKWERRTTDIPVDYVGFDIEDKFVFGYGLDIDELYRNLTYIGVVKT
ncbi:MAG: hypoxanthine phosphoribosyltransferase [Anaerolineaceae bacterium 4572_5.2]|nr:MAG: hypoxanthine phosphoribosyltransferase [Anaerolineaceae bacterium 4572_5.2]